MTITFWILVAFVFYVYAGYPLVLLKLGAWVQVWRDLRYVFGRGERRAVQLADWPDVTLLVCAYNEEKIIGERIRNALALDYPRERLEILVASDGSDDRTAEIVRGFASEGVRLIDYAERSGKVSVLNRSVPQCRGEIVVLSDANTMYDAAALRNLVRHFADERVGVVVGEMRLVSPNAAYKAEARYWRYETVLKFLENRLGAVVGANGGIYAIRKALFEPVASNTITDDFVIPMRICARGARAVYDCEALAFEETARDAATEAVRRVRIAAGNYQSMWTCRALLNPLRGAMAFCFWSHKVVRWLVPFALIALFVVNGLMALGVGAGKVAGWGWPAGVYRWLFAAQEAFYVLAAVGAAVRRPRVVRKVLGLPHYFTLMNLSLLRGFLRCVLGRQAVTWKRTER